MNPLSEAGCWEGEGEPGTTHLQLPQDPGGEHVYPRQDVPGRATAKRGRAAPPSAGRLGEERLRNFLLAPGSTAGLPWPPSRRRAGPASLSSSGLAAIFALLEGTP